METIKDLVGLTFETVNISSSYGDDVITFENKNSVYKLYHSQDCCECVNVEKITGSLHHLSDTPILEAIETNPELPSNEQYDSFTWTNYKFVTARGIVEILWYGHSNGYYSESVNFCKVK